MRRLEVLPALSKMQPCTEAHFALALG